MDHETLLDPAAAGRYLGGTQPIAKQTLAKWRCAGGDKPAFVKIGSLVRYRRADLDAWLEKQGRYGSTSEIAA